MSNIKQTAIRLPEEKLKKFKIKLMQEGYDSMQAFFEEKVDEFLKEEKNMDIEHQT